MTTQKTNMTDETSGRVHRRTKVAVVIADNRNKTIKVGIDRLNQHAKYGKYLRRQGVLHVHDEKNVAKTGDVVEIMECRPLSKTKSWRLLRVVQKSEQVAG
jgi:small subunit ribosomal protein S17